jgi:outer membrane protein
MMIAQFAFLRAVLVSVSLLAFLVPDTAVAKPKKAKPKTAAAAMTMAAPALAAAETASVALVTLEQALAAAYQTSPRLQARQAAVRAIDEQVAVAQAGWRPSINGSANYGRTQQTISGSDAVTQPRGAGIEITQPLLRLQTITDIQAAKRAVDAARADLDSTEQELLLDAVTAYMNLVRDQQILKLRQNSEQLLERQLTAARDRFRVGEITRTDISEAESRLASATAERIQAEGVVAGTRANYRRVIGDEPTSVKQPETMPVLPTSLDDTIATAESSNPSVIAADFAYQQADKQVDTALAKLLPEISAVGSASRNWDQSPSVRDRADRLTIGLRATVPLYQGGADYAATRAAKQTRSQRQLELEETRRLAREAGIQSWHAYKSAMASITSRKAAVVAADLALDGAEQEARVGTRTTLDVLDAEEDALDAKVSLVSAEHDAVVAAYKLLAATGKLTATAQNLKVTRYDPKAYYDDNAGKWIGIGE